MNKLRNPHIFLQGDILISEFAYLNKDSKGLYYISTSRLSEDKY